MTKQEWIEIVVSNIDDKNRKEAIIRELEEKITKRVGKENNGDVLETFGDPNKYFERHYSEKSSKKFSFIVGFALIIIGGLLLMLFILDANNILLWQASFAPATKNNVFYGAGIIFGVGLFSLINGLRKR